MFMNYGEIEEIKVEIKLKDLMELQETAKLYYSYFEEVMKLREKVKELEGKAE